VDEQSQKDDMRAAVRGDRERALARWRSEGRQPVFLPPRPEEPAPEATQPPETRLARLWDRLQRR
jgi:hypothetical protein